MGVYYSLAQVWCSREESTWLAQYLLPGGTNHLLRHERQKKPNLITPARLAVMRSWNTIMKYQDKRGEQPSKNVLTDLHFSPKPYCQTKHNIQFNLWRKRHVYFFTVALFKGNFFNFLIGRGKITFVLTFCNTIYHSFHFKNCEDQFQYHKNVQQKSR